MDDNTTDAIHENPEGPVDGEEPTDEEAGSVRNPSVKQAIEASRHQIDSASDCVPAPQRLSTA